MQAGGWLAQPTMMNSHVIEHGVGDMGGLLAHAKFLAVFKLCSGQLLPAAARVTHAICFPFHPAVHATMCLCACCSAAAADTSWHLACARTDHRSVPCPYCGRKFAQLTADRHIPHCKNTQAKPNFLKAGARTGNPLKR